MESCSADMTTLSRSVVVPEPDGAGLLAPPAPRSRQGCQITVFAHKFVFPVKTKCQKLYNKLEFLES